MSEAVAHSDLRPKLLDLLVSRFSPMRFASELLARESERTPRAAQNWLRGQNAPDVAALMELMARNDELADEVMALVEQRRRTLKGST